MWNRRLFAGFVNFDQLHWVSIIWDRVDACLLVYDTLEKGRELRFRKVAIAWRMALVEAGMPFGFDAFARPVSAQLHDWECGYLSSMLLFRNLRDLVGLCHDDLCEACPPSYVKTDGRQPPAHHREFPSGLHHVDWQLHPSRPKGDGDGSDGTQFEISSVKATIQVMILDELGIRTLAYLPRGTRETVTYPNGARKPGSTKASRLGYLPAPLDSADGGSRAASAGFLSIGGPRVVTIADRMEPKVYFSGRHRVVQPPPDPSTPDVEYSRPHTRSPPPDQGVLMPALEYIVDFYRRRGVVWLDDHPVPPDNTDRQSTIDLVSVSESLASDVGLGLRSPRSRAGSTGARHSSSPPPAVWSSDFNGIQGAVASRVNNEQARVMRHNTDFSTQTRGSRAMLLHWFNQGAIRRDEGRTVGRLPEQNGYVPYVPPGLVSMEDWMAFLRRFKEE
jgi:hypothetical protein